MAGASGTRPTGVTILAILSLIGGVMGILGSMTLVGLGAAFAAVTGGLGMISTLYGVVYLALSVVWVAVGYGFWTGKPWSWTYGSLIVMANVLLGIVGLAVTGFSGLFGLVITIAITLIILYYLNLTAIRTWFSAPASGFPVIGSALDNILPKG